MTVKWSKSAEAVTLVEAMVAMAVLAIAALGALGYQYHATTQARIAQAQITATRIAQLLLEDWKSTGGSSNYDPTTLKLGFSAAEEEGSDCFIIVNDLPMYIVLSHNDIAYDDVARVTLREIAVMVRWRRDHGQGPREVDDPSLILSTYVRIDASGG